MPKLFVIMPFGVRQLSTLPASAHDFDDVYQRLVIPAARAADWEVVRIDEVAATGSISDQYLHELYTADLVAADISMPNGNVYYELGVRQAISPSGDLLIAIQGTPVPFDLQNQRVFFYPREDAEWAQFQRQLQAVLQRHGQDLPRNPVREYLERQGHVVSLSRDSAGFESELNGRIDRARNAEQLVACWHWARKQGKLPVSATLALAERLGDAGYIRTAVDVLANAGTDSNDYEVHRQLGFYRRKLGPEHEEDALESFKRAAELNSSDPETWGMMGGLYKRQHNYPAARDAYDRGATLSPSSLYMRVNQAVMSVLTAARDPGYGIALYQRLYDSVVDDPNSTADYWALLVAAEAAFVLGGDARAHELFDDAANLGARAGDLLSSAEQLQLLADAGYRPSEANQLAVMLREKANTLERRLRPVPLAFDRREETPSTDSKIIFHLSDLHFGRILRNGQYRNMHRFYDSETNRRLSSQMSDEICRLLADRAKGPEAASIVVSGDLTYTATTEEFGLVESSLEELCEETRIAKSRILLVPGNHDVDWQSAKISPERRFDNYLSFARSFYGQELFRARYPLVGWDFTVDKARPRANEIVNFWSDGDVCYVGFNSCVYETDQHHYGFIGLRQLNHVSDWLKSQGIAPGVIRVAVLHHHLHPLPEAIESSEAPEVQLDISTIRDAGFVEQRLERLGFDLLMHGHKHKPQLRETRVRNRNSDVGKDDSALIVSGCGSTGVNVSELEHGEPNHYATVELPHRPRRRGAEFARIEWKELSLELGAEWATGPSWTLRG